MPVNPSIQIRSKSIVVFNKYTANNRWRIPYGSRDQTPAEIAALDNGTFQNLRSDRQRAALEKMQQSETYTGELKQGAKKRLTKGIEILTQSAIKEQMFLYTPKGTVKEVVGSFRLNFITLTIYSTDRMIKGKEGHTKCLEPFLKWARDNYGLSLYLWKAELQQRGQLHYHLCSNCFIPQDVLRNKWCELQERAGYLDSWFAIYPEYIMGKNGVPEKNYPTSATDVHSVYKVKDFASYLKKSIMKTYKKKDGSIISEFQKDIQNADTVGGKVWDCSLSIKRNKYHTIDCDKVTYQHLVQPFIRASNRKYKKEKYLTENGLKKFFKSPIVHTDNCSIYCFDEDVRMLIPASKMVEYEKFLEQIINFKRSKVEIDIDVGIFSGN